MRLKERLGLIKSWFLYYGKPTGSAKLRSFYADFIKPGMLCFDVGAHLGNRTSTWQKLGASVVAIEPQPACVRFLEKKFKHAPNVHLVKKGLGREIGKHTMHISSLNPAVSTLSKNDWMNRMKEAASFNLQWDETVEIEITTMDNLIEAFGVPDFCKIDTEGFEAEVLAGLSAAIPMLCFEVISIHKDTLEPCFNILDQLGNYEYNWSVGESLKFAMDKWTNSKEVISSIHQFPKKIFSGDIYARLTS
jgi:FkbM family methyltransferase